MRTHAAPDPDCDCGIYAARSPEALVPYLESAYPGRPSLGPVVGRVRLWGRVVSAERGWRGEYAYPDALYAPPQLMPAQQPESPCTAGLADYAVPVLPLVGATTPEVVESLRAA
ncbi:MAG TPA: hypothetical protein VMG74_04575 [Gaiellaceae bacterium]|nr:hypothetical protein [Gaiellaceae bacterium]